MKSWDLPVYLKVRKSDGKVLSCSTDQGLIQRSLLRNGEYEIKVEQHNPKQVCNRIMDSLTLVEKMFITKSWYAIDPEEVSE